MNQQETQLTNTSAFQLPGEKNGRPVEGAVAKTIRVEYCLYARKSSEDDERQALSIDSQIKEMAVQSETQGLRVTEIRKESHSAKQSGQRPVFKQLIADVRRGLFTGILSWAPDRLSRNAGDLGALVDLMDSGHLIEIRTHGQVFTNSPNDKFLLMILCSQAKLENDNRGINVKRGMKTKCELGFRPNMTPLGYLNDHYSGKGQKKVFVDKKRAL
jgi:DNA invertase Pin-like site-specific DNA recombinase